MLSKELILGQGVSIGGKGMGDQGDGIGCTGVFLFRARGWVTEECFSN